MEIRLPLSDLELFLFHTVTQGKAVILKQGLRSISQPGRLRGFPQEKRLKTHLTNALVWSGI